MSGAGSRPDQRLTVSRPGPVRARDGTGLEPEGAVAEMRTGTLEGSPSLFSPVARRETSRGQTFCDTSPVSRFTYHVPWPVTVIVAMFEPSNATATTQLPAVNVSVPPPG